MGDLYPLTDASHAQDSPLSSRFRFSYLSERPPSQSQFGNDRAHMLGFDRDHTSYLEAAATSSSLGLVASTDGRDGPSNAPLPSDSPNAMQPPSQPRRSRRERTRIELSADQPPTTQGQRRTRVYVACVQCRGRKIRCDGAKPMCFHCCQRGGNEQCSYDTLPKRRGPDRVQGARTRGPGPREGDGERPRRRRRRPATVHQEATSPQEAGGSYGIERPSVTASPSALDTLGDPVPDIHQQNAAAPNRSLEINVLRPLGSGVRLSSSASHDQTLTRDPTPNRNPPHDTRDIGYNSGTIAPFAAATDTHVVTAESQPRDEQESNGITPDPSVQFSRQTWWDHLLCLYSASIPASYHSLPLGQLQCDVRVVQIVEDVRFVFKSSSYWFSFLNVPRFYNTFSDPARRSRMQPSLLLALLAVSTFLQSTTRACPEENRRKAMILRNEAQAALEARLYARAIDGELAQAAWVLSLFEIFAHPETQATRTQSSLNILDSIIRTLTMTHLDSDNPATSRFSHNGMPVMDARLAGYFPTTGHNHSSVPTSLPTQHYVQQPHIAAEPTGRTFRCSCDEVSLGRQWPEAQTRVPLWVATPTWNSEWTEGDIKKEECRRLCWSALMLISGHTSYAAAINWRHSDFFVMEPSNYSILFPGESLLSSHSQDGIGGKDTVWALYLRAMLLWNACLRVRRDPTVSDDYRAEFAMRTWMATEAIEKALQQHTCGIERAFMYHGREFLFNTRMCISYEFQRFVPHVLIGLNRKKSEEWLRAQGLRAKAVMLGMHAVTGNIRNNLAQRPSFLWWFMGQICRALTLWEHDNSLTIALDVSKAFLEPIQFLASIYPGPMQQIRLDNLRERLRLACLTAEATGGYHPIPVEML